MFAQDQNWELFGYDMRRIWRYWLTAWREFLWGYDSPLKARLDEVVRVESEQGSSYFHAGNPISADGAECEAYLLPDDVVLTRTLKLPLAAEADIDAVMAFEVTANSPFPDADTGFGWKIARRNEAHLFVELAVASLSATMAYLGRTYNCHDAQAREVWARTGESVVVLEGFGERKRLGRYNRRLKRVAATIGIAAILLIVITASSAGFKYLEWIELEDMSGEIDGAAKQPVQMRDALNNANETIGIFNAVASQYPSPHVALANLTRLLGDDVSLEYFNMEGRDIKFRGIAGNAAAIVQQLTEEPTYASVEAPQAITTQGTAGMERFFLNITLAEE